MSLSKWMSIIWLCCRGNWQDRRHLQTEGGTRAGRRRWGHLKVFVAQLGPTLSDPVDCCQPGSSVPGLLQARILEWVAIPFSRGSFQPRDWTWVSCIGGRFFTIWTTREAWCSCMHSDKCMGSCVHHPSVIMNGSIILKLCVVPYSFQNSPSRILCFFECHINGAIKYTALFLERVWLL